MNTEFKVIEIINSKEIIVDYGFADGAKVGDVVRILQIGRDIIDEERGVLLGTLDAIKDEVTVCTIYEQFSLCKKVQIIRSSHLDPFANISDAFITTKKEFKDIHVDQSLSTNLTVPLPDPIKVGDKAIVIKTPAVK
jgi:hypothetical protein